MPSPQLPETMLTLADLRPLSAGDQNEIDFWKGMLEVHRNRGIMNISREALSNLLRIIENLRTEQRPSIEHVRAQRCLQVLKKMFSTAESLGATRVDVGDIGKLIAAFERGDMDDKPDDISIEHVDRRRMN